MSLSTKSDIESCECEPSAFRIHVQMHPLLIHRGLKSNSYITTVFTRNVRKQICQHSLSHQMSPFACALLFASTHALPDAIGEPMASQHARRRNTMSDCQVPDVLRQRDTTGVPVSAWKQLQADSTMHRASVNQWRPSHSPPTVLSHMLRARPRDRKRAVAFKPMPQSRSAPHSFTNVMHSHQPMHFSRDKAY